MNGIELAENFYFSALEPLLEKRFGELLPRIAAGIAGRGSECFGFDDDISRDHDFTVGAALWISEDDDRKYGVELARTYNEALEKFNSAASCRSALGYSEFGVGTVRGFFLRHLGIPGAPQSFQEWLNIPETALAEVVNGRIFRDDAGIFTAIRQEIISGMPRDVRLKKLAACAVMMAQSGQYNFERCMKHREPGAAMLALSEFVRHTIRIIFLLNNRFTPYYKWQFRALRQLPKLSGIADDLETLLLRELNCRSKCTIIENICSNIISELAAQKLSGVQDNYLEPHAFALMEQITNQQIRSLHVMEG